MPILPPVEQTSQQTEQDNWRLMRAMEVCASAGPLACGVRQCMVGKPCALADEIHDAMLEAEQRATD